MFVPMTRFFAGAARAAQGRLEEGLAAMLPALVEHREMVGVFINDILRGLLGAAYARAEPWEEGLATVEEGLELSAKVREHVFAAELWRLKGELLLGRARTSKRGTNKLASRPAAAAEQCFRRALEIAHQQEAASLALRAAMSLTRSSAGREGRRAALDLLRSVYASFSGGVRDDGLEGGQGPSERDVTLTGNARSYKTTARVGPRRDSPPIS
jgi:hypothetical protein